MDLETTTQVVAVTSKQNQIGMSFILGVFGLRSVLAYRRKVNVFSRKFKIIWLHWGNFNEITRIVFGSRRAG